MKTIPDSLLHAISGGDAPPPRGGSPYPGGDLGMEPPPGSQRPPRAPVCPLPPGH